MAAPEVRIVRHDFRNGPKWDVYDGDDWFAGASTPLDALPYVRDLLCGPGVRDPHETSEYLRDVQEDA